MIKKKPPSIQETVNRLQASLLDTHELQAQQQLLQETIQALQVLQMDQETEPRRQGLQALQEILQAIQELLEVQERNAAVLGQAPDVPAAPTAEALSGVVTPPQNIPD